MQDFYRVICKDGGEYYFATRRLFNLNGALHYAKQIAPSREPLVVRELP